jgi:hypothetical protein
MEHGVERQNSESRSQKLGDRSQETAGRLQLVAGRNNTFKEHGNSTGYWLLKTSDLNEFGAAERLIDLNDLIDLNVLNDS